MDDEEKATQLALESLGAGIASTSAYESDVIRKATQSSAPKLTGIGFPDLRSLAPSFDTNAYHNNDKIHVRRPNNFNADIPHIKTILSRTRSSLSKLLSSSHNNQNANAIESKEANLLRMKITILTSFLQTYAANNHDVISKDEWNIIKQAQRVEDKNRYIALSSMASSSSSKVLRIIEDTETKRDSKKNKSSKHHSNKLKHGSRLSKAQRLEEVKKGMLEHENSESILNGSNDKTDEKSSNTSSFGTHILAQRRKSIMEWKKIHAQEATEIQNLEEEEDYWKEIYRQKQQRRKERRERRRMRQEQLPSASHMMQPSDENHVTNDDNNSDQDNMKEEETKQEWNGNEKPYDVIQENKESHTSNSLSIDLEDDDSKQEYNAKQDDTKKKENKNQNTNLMSSKIEVSCPLCQRTFKLPKNHNNAADIDHFLGNHMDRCQRRGRKRKIKGTYTDVDDDDIINNNHNILPNASASTKHDKEHEIDVNVDKYEEPEEEENELTEDLCANRKKRSKKNDTNIQTKSFTTNKTQTKQPKLSNTSKKEQVNHKQPDYQKLKSQSLDDYELPLYTDRVEEWIDERIISSCSDNPNSTRMSEHDPDEKPPGMAIYKPNLIIPSWINDRLFPYQRTGLKWMYELFQQQSGGIVGDEMGLGKTVQICAFLQSMILSRNISSILILCPATLLVHWLQELARWAPGLRRILIHKVGEKADGFSREISWKLLKALDRWINDARKNYINEPLNEQDIQEEDIYANFDREVNGNNDSSFSFCGTGYVVVTTYDSIRRASDVWTGHHWDYIILDEGQKIKNPDAEVTLACKRFKTPHRLLLSGTPIQNNLRELWSLFDFVFPGRLGTLPAFETEFSDPIKRGGYSNASPMQIQLAYRCALVLRDLINPYLLRRRKRDVKEVSRMPGKTEQVLFCRLSTKQRALYKTYLASDEVKRILRGSEQSFRAITVLRKICNHPDLIDNISERPCNNNSDSSSDEEDLNENENGFDSAIMEHSGKLEVLAKILPLWHKQGHRVLVFCQWRKMLSIIQKFVMMHDWKFYRMDGNTSVSTRQQMVDTFNGDSSYFLMLMTTRTGGIGLNLTGADRIILYDPDWNPQTDNQSLERVWRFGQKNAVTVYRLITAGTIEEKIYHRQIFKTALSNQVLQDPKQRRLFTRKDLKDLFTLKEDIHSVESGGKGFTETAQITKGDGVIDPDDVEVQGSDSAEKDNTDTLNAVLRSKGLAGLFEHDAFSQSAGKKSRIEREMDEKARNEAQKAAVRLESSVEGNPCNIPTWTGYSETDKLFGAVQGFTQRGPPTKSKNSSMFGRPKPDCAALDVITSNFENGFGGANVAGAVHGSALNGKSSSELLENLRRRRQNMLES